MGTNSNVFFKNKIDDLIKENKADAAIIFSPINRFWFCHFSTSYGILIQNKKKQTFLYLDSRYYEAFKNNKNIDKIIKITSFPLLIEEIKKTHKINTAVIENNITLSEYDNIISKIAKKFIKVNFQIVRAEKTAEELLKLQKAADIACDSISYVAKKFIKIGVTEKKIASEIVKYYLDNGCTGASFDPIVCFGKNGAIPHHQPSDIKLTNNTPILIDTGCLYQGFCSDITRMLYIGKPSKEFLEAYQCVLDAQITGINTIDGKNTGEYVDSKVREIIKNSKYDGKFTHGTGHGVGCEIHELPNVSSNQKMILRNNCVITIEPGVYLPNKFGIRIEDTVVVKNNKGVILTNKLKKQLLILK